MKLRLCSVSLLLALTAAPAFACPFCYDALKGAGSTSQAAIDHGILTLLLPTVGLMLGLVGFAFCYSRNGHEPENAEMVSPPEQESTFVD